MDLRYRLAVVTGAGGGLGRDIAVALSRVGAAVLSVDRDGRAAEETASLVRRARVMAWSFQGDLTREDEQRMLAARARDLGGMDLLVDSVGCWCPAAARCGSLLLTSLFVEGLAERRGRRDGTPAVVNVGPGDCGATGAHESPQLAAARAALVRFTTSRADPATSGGARVMAVVLDRSVPSTGVARAVLGLLSRGVAGQVVEVGAPEPGPAT